MHTINRQKDLCQRYPTDNLARTSMVQTMKKKLLEMGYLRGYVEPQSATE